MQNQEKPVHSNEVNYTTLNYKEIENTQLTKDDQTNIKLRTT